MRLLLFLLTLPVSILAGGPVSSPDFLMARQNALLPQWVLTQDDTLMLVWREKGEGGDNIFLARHGEHGWQKPVRVNDQTDSVIGYVHDEIRASVATGPKGKVAVAWSDKSGDVRAAIATGTSFQPSVRLNQDEGKAAQSFPAIAFDSKGRLHGVWLDARRADPGMEEPADLYMATVSGDQVSEKNLTKDQEASVCGCCRPFMNIDAGDTMHIRFRKVDKNSYRDIYQITGAPEKPTALEPMSPPIWQLRGCPMAGPITVGGATLWLDGSTGKRRLLEAVDAQTMPKIILESTDEKHLLFPPRQVLGADGGLILQPMSPKTLLMKRSGSDWKTLADDLPLWATGGLLRNGVLHLIGVEEGKIRYLARTF